MINVGNIGRLGNMREATLDRLRMGNQVLAQAQTMRSHPAPRGPGMSLVEAQRQLATLKARSEQNRREHQAEMAKIRGESEDFEPMPRVDAYTHDVASIFVQAQFGPLDREARLERQRSVGDAMLCAYQRGVVFTFLR